MTPGEWGAARDYDRWTDSYVAKDKIAIHYGGGANTAGSVTGVSAEQVADEKTVLHGWEAFHINTRGWRGIAYNYAIGQSGTVFRLRGWNQNGAHYGNDDVDRDGISDNAESVAVVFILGGDQAPTPAALDGFARLRTYLEETVRQVLPLFGHREIAESGGHSTSCPGTHLMAYVTANRDSSAPAASGVSAGKTPPPEQQPPKPDPLAVFPPLLREGDTHLAVPVLRSMLWGLGYRGLRWYARRRFTKRLERRVVRFQTDAGIEPDGIVGPDTRAALGRAAQDLGLG